MAGEAVGTGVCGLPAWRRQQQQWGPSPTEGDVWKKKSRQERQLTQRILINGLASCRRENLDGASVGQVHPWLGGKQARITEFSDLRLDRE